MILLVSCFDKGQLKRGCVPWMEVLSRGRRWIIPDVFSRSCSSLCAEIGRGTFEPNEPTPAEPKVPVLGSRFNKPWERGQRPRPPRPPSRRNPPVDRECGRAGFDWPLIWHSAAGFHGWAAWRDEHGRNMASLKLSNWPERSAFGSCPASAAWNWLFGSLGTGATEFQPYYLFIYFSFYLQFSKVLHFHREKRVWMTEHFQNLPGSLFIIYVFFFRKPHCKLTEFILADSKTN